VSGPRGTSRSRGRCAALAACVLLLAPRAAAHDFWIQPSSFRPGPSERVAVQLMVGEAGQGQPVARDEARIVRFAMLGPGAGSGPPVGELPIVGQDGHDPAGWVRTGTTGQIVLVYTNTPARIEMPAAKFEAYLREEGLDAIVTQRTERGSSDQPAREIYRRCAKALLDVRDADGRYAAPSQHFALAIKDVAFRAQVKLPLELVPEVDPFQLATEAPAMRVAEGTPEAAAPPPAATALAPLPIVLLLDGQPLAGALVRALRLDPGGSPDEQRPSARTDADGRCRLALPGPGRWLITAVHMRDAPAGADADYESLWASLSFEVPAAR
jgi:hypothetical protein